VFPSILQSLAAAKSSNVTNNPAIWKCCDEVSYEMRTLHPSSPH